MNSCILMAQIVQEPELRYTSENQTAISEMLVQFPGLRAEDPPATLKVVGWGSLAQEIQQHYHQGDHVIIEGRLGMNTVERPEGFKEKRAELTAQRIHPLGDDVSIGSSTFAPAERNVTGLGMEQPRPIAVTPSNATDGTSSPRTPEKVESLAQDRGFAESDLHSSVPQATKPPVRAYQVPKNEQDVVDDIPF